MKIQSGTLILTDGVPTSVQEVSSAKNSPMINGKTVLVLDRHMDDTDVESDHGKAESLLVQWFYLFMYM